MEAVPTSIAEGPDGSLYVGELTGFPFPVGGARVYRVPANGGTPVVVAEGFTNIIDIAIGADGAAYVLEHDANSLLVPGDAGRLTKIGPFGLRTELAAGQFFAPGKMAVGTDNAIYVTVNARRPAPAAAAHHAVASAPPPSSPSNRRSPKRRCCGPISWSKREQGRRFV